MRKLLFLFVTICTLSSLSAQSKVSKKEIEKATADLTALYQLTPTQKEQAYKMQERRLNNLRELETIKNSEPDAYTRKRAAVRIAFESQLQRILTDEQTKIYQAQVAERHQRESLRKKELKRQGASKEQIEKSLLEIE
jgi:hypothetical protein